QVRDGGEVLRGVGGVLQVAPEHLAAGRQDQGTTEDLRHLGQLELELGDDADIATATADRPEEIGVRGRAGGDDLAVGRDDARREQVVDRQPVAADHEADTAAGGEPTRADRVRRAGREGEPVRGGGTVQVAGGRACLDAGRAGDRIDDDPFHGGEVDDNGVVGDAVAGEAVPATAD